MNPDTDSTVHSCSIQPEICTKGGNPGQKYFKGDNKLMWRGVSFSDSTHCFSSTCY